nr:hypothetical protein [Variovorax boronicumulans]
MEAASSGEIADFTTPDTFYKKGVSDILQQGDLLSRESPAVSGPLSEYHRYHFDKEENELFAIITQSCDLYPHGGRPKARYIVLAPVRPLRKIIEKEFKGLFEFVGEADMVLASNSTKEKYKQFVGKLVNNNDPRYFFMPGWPQGRIAEDMCIMTSIMMPIKVDHYEKCQQGRLAQISDIFQAKLGSLIGQQFSRVGTPDWAPKAVDEKVNTTSQRSITWVSDLAKLKASIAARKARDEASKLSDEDIVEMSRQIAVDKQQAEIEKVYNHLKKYLRDDVDLVALKRTVGQKIVKLPGY